MRQSAQDLVIAIVLVALVGGGIALMTGEETEARPLEDPAQVIVDDGAPIGPASTDDCPVAVQFCPDDCGAGQNCTYCWYQGPACKRRCVAIPC